MPTSSSGLFRTSLAGPESRLTEAFDSLRMLPDCISVPEFGLYGAVVPVPAPADTEEGVWRMASIRDEIFLVISDCNYAHSRSESVLPESFVEFHFSLSGPASVDFSDTGTLQVNAPNLLVCRQGADVRYQVTCGPGPWQSVGLYVTQRYFDRLLRALGSEADRIHVELAAVGSDQIYNRQMPFSVEALQIAGQLLASPYHGARQMIYLEGKCTEILCACIEMWLAHARADNPGEMLSARDLRLIEQAREMIVGDMRLAPTIPELARAVGTNASKLKRGFKFLYGMTIFEYGHRCRMNHALRLLIGERQPVGQVALAVGYQHQTSFTAAFRDYFGFAPKDARRLASPIPLAPSHAALPPADGAAAVREIAPDEALRDLVPRKDAAKRTPSRQG
ncbi:helix-turn-helix transcriptional regulator [Paraburkholderia susongensis]|uniref:Transcriptional regulator, AraC family n=1 Tax=Paraburkholderia susongensis TaxID=1515439 RepID=A0A1X7L8Y8_9BURK|nr:AraC family transcriptional regulator [Paraburkholderia susongensis]SMG49629.1 transcriptional regulator, AraC family [Paraburkholderia susongensis]